VANGEKEFKGLFKGGRVKKLWLWDLGTFWERALKRGGKVWERGVKRPLPEIIKKFFQEGF